MSVIAKVSKPTPWISNRVVVRKPNKLRLCIDPLHLNKGIIRNHYPTPTVEDIALKLTKAKEFSVVDGKKKQTRHMTWPSRALLDRCRERELKKEETSFQAQQGSLHGSHSRH